MCTLSLLSPCVDTGKHWTADIVATATGNALTDGWQAFAAAWELQPGDELGWHADPANPGMAAIAILNRAVTVMVLYRLLAANYSIV